jgi:hypothetical protein
MRPLTILFATFVLLGAATAGRTETLLEQGYRHMYNHEFPAAHQTFLEWQRIHPEDPFGQASDAACYLFWEFDRLHILEAEFFTQEQHFYTDRKLTPDPELKRKFDAAVASAKALASKSPNDQNSMFSMVLANGLQSDYIGLIEKRYTASFQIMKTARQQAEHLLAINPDFTDAWVAVGVENYMLSVKPLAIRWLLRMAGGETNREVGIQKLKLAAATGHYLAPFARLLLAVAALRDKNVPQAREILQGLLREYPHNDLYATELARLQPAAAAGGAGADR